MLPDDRVGWCVAIASLGRRYLLESVPVGLLPLLEYNDGGAILCFKPSGLPASEGFILQHVSGKVLATEYYGEDLEVPDVTASMVAKGAVPFGDLNPPPRAR
jgi:hypothetical protein